MAHGTAGCRWSSLIGPSPAADATIDTDSAAASSSGGNRPGIVRARSVLPTPGGPIRSRPCPPARAISSAAPSLDLTPDLGQVGNDPQLAPVRAAGARRSPRVPDPRSSRAASRRALAEIDARARRPPHRPGWLPRRHPPHRRAVPRRRPVLPPRPDGSRGVRCAATIGRMPGTGRTSPPSPSSPIRATDSRSDADLLRAEQDADGHRQVERRTGLAQLRGREVDGDAPRREGEAGVADRTADAFARLLHGRVGEADDREARAAPGRRPPRPG